MQALNKTLDSMLDSIQGTKDDYTLIKVTCAFSIGHRLYQVSKFCLLNVNHERRNNVRNWLRDQNF